MTLTRLFLLSLAIMLSGMAMMYFRSMPQIDIAPLEPFDMLTGGYDHADAVAILTALSPEATAIYLGPQRLADTIFPIGFCATLALGIFLGLRGWTRIGAALLALVPLVYFSFDMLENAAVAGMLRAGPVAISADQVARASGFTQAKGLFVNLSLALLVVATLARLVLWWRDRRAKA